MFDIHFHEAADTLAAEAKTAVALRLFLILPTCLSYTEWRPLDQSAVARRLKVDRSTVTKGMHELQALGVVERRGNKRTTEWRLSPDYGWRGDVESYEAAAHRRKLFTTPGSPPSLRLLSRKIYCANDNWRH